MGVSRFSRETLAFTSMQYTSSQLASMASTHSLSPHTLPMGAFRSSSSLLHESSNDMVCRYWSRSVTSHMGLAGVQAEE